MAITLFPNAQHITLTEDDKANPHKSPYENYTGIVFDTDKNEFKIITGKFRDKKDMYEKMTKEDKYLRRAYESKIWDWIQDNAETPVDGYLMLSTAVSKWLNNNVLSKYYKKLLHDLPYINREGRKGDPQTMGTKASFESTKETEEDKMLNEAIMNEAERDFETDIKNQIKQDVNDGLMSKHKIDIYPNYKDGSIAKKPVLSFPNTYLYNDLYDGTWSKSLNTGTEKSENSAIRDNAYRVWNPDLFRELYVDKQNYENGKLNSNLHKDQADDVTVIVDDNFSDPIKLSKRLISTKISEFINNYQKQGKTDWMPYKNYRTGHSVKTNVIQGIEQGKYDPSMQTRIDNLTGANASLKIKNFNDNAEKILKNEIIDLKQKAKDKKIPETDNKELFKLKCMLTYNKLSKMISEISTTKGTSIAEKEAALEPLLKKRNQVLEDYRNSLVQNNNFNREQNMLDMAHDATKPINYSNIVHNSAAGDQFIGQIDAQNRSNEQLINKYMTAMFHGNLDLADRIERLYGKDNLKKYLVYGYNKAKRENNIDLADKIKSLYKKEPKDYTDAELKISQRIARRYWEARKKQERKLPNTMAQQISIPEPLKRINDKIIDKYNLTTTKLYPGDNRINFDKIRTLAYQNLGDKTGLEPAERTEYFANHLDEYENELENAIKKVEKEGPKKDISKEIKSPEERLEKAIEDYKNYKNKDLYNKSSESKKFEDHLNFIIKGFDAKKEIEELRKEFLKKYGNDDEFFNILKKNGLLFSDLEEAQVNDGATALMQQTDQMAKNLQQNAMLYEDNTHSELNSELFEDEKLKDDIRDALIKIADTFKEKLKLSFEPVDIYFTGSEANYNYNENSDIDLHLVYDFENAGISAEILNKYFQSAKRIFNDEHKILIKGIPVEVGVENLAEPLTTSGVYSLISNDWVIKPQYANVEIEEPEEAISNEVRNIIEDAISSQDQNEIGDMIKLVWDMRKKGLEEEGEFGPRNTLFKTLRNDGILARLKDAYYASESRDLSLESIMKEDYFGDKDEIFTIEDDLINKPEQEIYDGLMDHYKGNEKEALAKLEDVLKTCDDGYKDKLNGVIQRIKENTNFENKCKRIIEAFFDSDKKANDIDNKIDIKMTPSSYLDHINDIAEVKEMLNLCYNGIHPNIKYKRPPLRYTDKNGKKRKFVLLGIGLDSPTVKCQEINVGETQDGFYKILYGEKFDMPVQEFRNAIESPENMKWIDKVVGNEGNLEDVIEKIKYKAEQFANSYNNWYDTYKDIYDLDDYSKKARLDIYKDIVKRHQRPDYVFKKYRKIDDWRNKLPKEESTLDEAEKLEYVKAGSTRGGWVNDVLDSYGIDHKFTQTPFAVEPPKIKTAKLLGALAPKKKWYIIKGIEEGKDPKIAYIQQVTEEGESVSDKTVKPVPISWIQDQMAISAKGDQDNSPENTLWRAGEQIFNPQGKNRLGRTNKAGEWWTLQPEDIEMALQIVEEEKTAELAAKKAKYPNIRFLNEFENLIQIYRTDPYSDLIKKALKEFDPDNERCIKRFNTSSGPRYAIWLPAADGMAYPPEYGLRNPYENLMKQ